MNSLRIRAVKLERNKIADYDTYPYAVVISMDNLIWWVVSRHTDSKAAMDSAMGLESFLRANQLGRASHVLWQANLR